MQWSNDTFTENLRRIAEKTQVGCYSKGIENHLKLNKIRFLVREGFPLFDESFEQANSFVRSAD